MQLNITSQDLTDAEKNLIAYLRSVAKPHVKVEMTFDKNGMWDFFLVDVTQRVTISNECIKEICISRT